MDDHCSMFMQTQRILCKLIYHQRWILIYFELHTNTQHIRCTLISHVKRILSTVFFPIVEQNRKVWGERRMEWAGRNLSFCFKILCGNASKKSAWYAHIYNDYHPDRHPRPIILLRYVYFSLSVWPLCNRCLFFNVNDTTHTHKLRESSKQKRDYRNVYALDEEESDESPRKKKTRTLTLCVLDTKYTALWEWQEQTYVVLMRISKIK